MRQPSLRELAERVAERQPRTLATDRRRAIIAARDAAQLEEWRAPLVLGHLVICGNCDSFQFGSDPAGLGHCSRFDTEAAPFCPFRCPEFQIAKEPVAPLFLPDPDGARVRARKYAK